MQTQLNKSLLVEPKKLILTYTVSMIEVLLLTLTIGISLLVIVASNVDHLLNTMILLLLTLFGGLRFAKKTANYLGDPNLRILGPLWIFKVLATIVLLYWGWMPQLDPDASASWGYDPQRFYKYSWELVANDWAPNFGLNYLGITYYYGAIFAVLGWNPIIPALINSFVTYVSILFIIRSLYAFTPECTAKDWRLAYLILIPEVLWYDVMTSRETLTAALILMASLLAGRFIVGLKNSSTIRSVILFALFSLAIIAIRPSMIVALAGSVLLMLFLLQAKKSTKFLTGTLLLFIVIPLIGVGPKLQELAGGYGFSFISMFQSMLSDQDNITITMDGWSENSIGMLLMPNNFFEALFYLPIRMILYLASPLPNVSVSIPELISGSWSAWQRLMTMPTSFLMLFLFPYVLAGTSLSWVVRKRLPGLLIVPIAFWVNFAAVAGGNLIIHERYRLMSTLLLFACAWIGYTRSSKTSVNRWAIFWFSLLGFAALFYLCYKFI